MQAGAGITQPPNSGSHGEAGGSIRRIAFCPRPPTCADCALAQYLIAAPPIEAIAQASRKSHCEIAVMGAISRSGFKRLLIGNTAEQILDELTCDILVIKPANFNNRIPRVSRGARLRENVPEALGYAFGPH